MTNRNVPIGMQLCEGALPGSVSVPGFCPFSGSTLDCRIVQKTGENSGKHNWERSSYLQYTNRLSKTSNHKWLIIK